MSEYKKEAPENTSGCMTRSSPSKREPDIEWHLAEILNLVERLKSDSLSDLDSYRTMSDYEEECDEIIDRVRKTWDLVPDAQEMPACPLCGDKNSVYACRQCAAIFFKDREDKS